MGRPSKELKSEYITVTELSKLVHRSPQSIYKKMKQKPSFNRYIRVFDGKKYVHKSAAWQEFGVELDGDKPLHEIPPVSSKPEDILIGVLKDQIRANDEQLKVKDEQIKALQEALRNEQVLLAQAYQRIEFLETKTTTPPDPDPQPETTPPAADDLPASSLDGDIPAASDADPGSRRRTGGTDPADHKPSFFEKIRRRFRP